MQSELDGVEVEYVSAPYEYEVLLAPKEDPESERMGLGSSGLGFVPSGSSFTGLSFVFIDAVFVIGACVGQSRMCHQSSISFFELLYIADTGFHSWSFMCLLGQGFTPGLGAGATPALGSDYGSETPYGGLGLGATPAVNSGAVTEDVKAVRSHSRLLHACLPIALSAVCQQIMSI
jgi:hypothetical protein